MKKIIRSFGYAFNGLAHAFEGQTNLKVHVVFALSSFGLGGWLGISVVEWCLVLLCCALVLALEIMNTAIEQLVDLVSPRHHPLAGKVKDMAAGAVLLAAVFAAVIGLVIFAPYLAARAGY